MACPKKYFLATLFFAFVLVISTPSAQALSNKYYDFGPYYNQSQVLGFSFSSLENLPELQLPDNLNLPPAQGILPDSPFYFLEKVVENTQLTFTLDPVRREQLRLDIASERLTEAKTLMYQGKSAAASSALEDYSKTLNAVSQNLATIIQRGDPEAQDLATKAEEVASAQTVVATALSLTATPAQAESWSQAANAARAVLDKVAEAKGEPAIPQDLSTGLQSLKEEGLISEEESNKLYGLKNRSQVREELNKLTSSGSMPPSEVAKLDEAVARYYPEVQEQNLTNLGVLELRSYQALPQPSEEVVDQLQKWQDDPRVPPSNDIKPYLWYNRAHDLAKEIDLSSFSQNQQAELVRFYPQVVIANPTYSPPPSPSPSPSPAAQTTDQTSPSGSGQTATPASEPSAIPSPTPAPAPATPYLQNLDGALPGQPTYIWKQISEGLNLTLTFDPAEKARLRMQQAERRLAEAASLAGDPKKTALYESALENYRQTIADASDRLKRLKDTPATIRVAKALEAQAARHEVVFEKGLLPPPAKNPQLISDVIKSTEDAMDRSADVLDRPALPAALSSRLGDLKAQGLILAEEAQDLVDSLSREEVRSKIRKLVELKTFPPADAKKLDEAQIFTTPSDYNQLVEVRKVEELQNLRSEQTNLAQTPTLRATASSLGQKEAILTSSIDPSLIKPEDLAGRDDLIKTYQNLISTPRPINGGQFGSEATPGAQIATASPRPQDAVLSTCPEGAVFKQFEGCVWADSGRKINDYDQYKCDGPRQYYSFAAKKCVASDDNVGFRDDTQPICPVGYAWSWQTQSCQAFTGGGLPYPSPSPESEPIDEGEIAERSKSCPEGSSYKSPRGCVWDSSDKPVYDSDQYRCGGRGQYYSFDQQKCVASPKEGEPYPEDASPACKEANTYWSWSAGKCIQPTQPLSPDQQATSVAIIDEIRPNFVTPDSPFYFLKRAGEAVGGALAFSAQAKGEVKISQARERLAESYWALEKGKTEEFDKALSNYTAKMQELYNDLSKSSLSDQAKKAIGEKLTKEAVEQNLILQKIEVLAKDDAATAISAASSAVIRGVDKAADLSGEPPIPNEVKEKIDALPEQMISEEDKKKLLETNSRVEVRLKLGEVAAKGGLTAADTAFLNEDFDAVGTGVKLKIGELKKLEQITNATDQKNKLEEKIAKNEEIVQKLQEFQKDFEPGREVPAEIRPYVRLSRIEEVAQTIRPDIVRLGDFQNRKDIVLAVATLQEEFRPTKEAIRRVEEFRRRNPNLALPPELARVEALSYSLGVRNQAGPCYLPTPPFPANTPCPAPGAAIPIVSYGSGASWSGWADTSGNLDKDGKPLVYGQGPTPVSAGVCPDGSHWMYDSGGWCMSNSGNYSSSSYTSYTPTGTGSGYTPYSPYYTAPGAPPATFGYPVGDNSLNDGCPYGYDSDGRGNCIPNSYPSSSYSYSPPSYYGSAPTYYTTNPPPGTVPGSGPRPTAPGQCPTGYHWMSDSGGWCMADGPTYVPGGPPPSSYPSGTTYNYYSPNLTQSSCGPGYYWDGRGCIPTTYSGGGSSPSSYQYGCTPGYYWDGSKCVAGSYEGSGWSDTTARSQSWCQPPSGGCGSNSYWDYGSCYCRSSSTYYGGSGPSPSNQCQGLSCGGGAWLDYSTCSCRYSGGSGTSSTGSPITCYPPSQGCPGGWYDYGTCSCKTSSSTSTTSGGSSSGSCPSGSHWMSDNGGYCMSDGGSTGTTSGGSTTTTSGSSSTGSCPSGYHWMSDNGGWCMQDGSSGSSSTTTSSPAPSSSPAPTTETTPPPSSAPSTESTPPPSTESTPPPSSPSP